MKKPKEVKSVLFDMDGVLVDSFEAWYSAFRDTLEKFGEYKLDKEKFKEGHWGTELAENMEKLGLGKEAVEYCRSRYDYHISKIKIYPDTRRVLKSIDKEMGVVTSTSEPRAEKVLNHFNIRQFFDVVVTPQSVDKPKPAPDSVLKACEELGVRPEDTLFVGDNESDIQAGKRAGCFVVGKGVDGDIRIEELGELLEIL